MFTLVTPYHNDSLGLIACAALLLSESQSLSLLVSLADALFFSVARGLQVPVCMPVPLRMAGGSLSTEPLLSRSPLRSIKRRFASESPERDLRLGSAKGRDGA